MTALGQSRPQSATTRSLARDFFAMFPSKYPAHPTRCAVSVLARTISDANGGARRGVASCRSADFVLTVAVTGCRDGFSKSSRGKYGATFLSFAGREVAEAGSHHCSVQRSKSPRFQFDANTLSRVANISFHYTCGPISNGLTRPPAPLQFGGTPCRYCGMSPSWCTCDRWHDRGVRQ